MNLEPLAVNCLGKTNILTRGRLARKLFSPSALPAAVTPVYIDAASVSARGDAQCVWSHESSSHRPTRGNMAVSAQAALFQAAARKLLSKLLHASGSTSAFKLRCSAQVSLRKTLSACICAQDAQPELSCGGAPRTIRLRFRVAIFWSKPELPRTRESNPRLQKQARLVLSQRTAQKFPNII